MFYKIYCCAAIHGCIWMNNVPNESRICMPSCTEISFVISFFTIKKFWIKPGFPFLNSHCIDNLKWSEIKHKRKKNIVLVPCIAVCGVPGQCRHSMILVACRRPWIHSEAGRSRTDNHTEITLGSTFPWLGHNLKFRYNLASQNALVLLIAGFVEKFSHFCHISLTVSSMISSFCVQFNLRNLYFPSNWPGNITSDGKYANLVNIIAGYNNSAYGTEIYFYDKHICKYSKSLL